MRSIALHCFILVFSFGQLSAQKTITLEDVYTRSTFRTKSVPGFNFMKDGKHYTTLEGATIKKYDLISGKFVEDIFVGTNFKDVDGFSGNVDSYSFSDDESKIIIENDGEQIYRHSQNATVHIYDIKSKDISSLSKDKVANAELSPDNSKVAYTFKNNLYIKNLSKNQVTQVTQDGAKNKIINGLSDWVYEEEFGFTRAFYWSPDGKKLAFIRFDESAVPEFTMQMFNDEMYPENVTFKYPKVGENNASVQAMCYDIAQGKTKKLDLGNMNNQYIPRIKWTKDPAKVVVYKMNRHQNLLQLHQFDTKRDKSVLLLEETNKYYIDITDDIRFLSDGRGFIWSSEREGYNQLYWYSDDGKLKNKITDGQYDITSFYGVDERAKRVYFQAAKVSPMEKHVYSILMDGSDLKDLTPARGTSNAQFSKTMEYFANTHSTINNAPSYTVYDKNGKEIRVIEDNKNYGAVLTDYGVSTVEFFTFTTTENVKLNGYMIKPRNFDSSRKYPVFMTQYSGPGSQSVNDSWGGRNYWWYQMIAQNGYIVVCVDGRGTGSRGEEFKKMTYLQMGHYETLDQIETAKYLGSLPYVEKSRIGIYGWSYGGFMSSLCILKGNDVFKAAIAIAPVTSWKWYDSIYTERYMRTVAENEKGYKDNSPVYFADRLKGKYLLCHGMADDNVHFQNAAEMSKALIKANKQFETYYYPNRNHGIYGDNATIHLFTKMTNFIYDNI
jgi:dipeptidyl-peptidase 4